MSNALSSYEERVWIGGDAASTGDRVESALHENELREVLRIVLGVGTHNGT